MLSSFTVHSNSKLFLNWIVTCNEKWILYDTWRQPAPWLDREEALKKPNLHQKKDHGHWWSAPRLIHSFLNPSKTITSDKYAQQINEMHWKLQSLQPALVNRKASVLHDNAQLHVSQPALQKLNELGYEVLPHPPYSFNLSPTNYHFKHLDNFWQGKSFNNHQEAESAFLEFVKSWSMIFML